VGKFEFSILSYLLVFVPHVSFPSFMLPSIDITLWYKSSSREVAWEVELLKEFSCPLSDWP
jgi:hypothetical protein